MLQLAFVAVVGAGAATTLSLATLPPDDRGIARVPFMLGVVFPILVWAARARALRRKRPVTFTGTVVKPFAISFGALLLITVLAKAL